jgi:hypothetical protein
MMNRSIVRRITEPAPARHAEELSRARDAEKVDTSWVSNISDSVDNNSPTQRNELTAGNATGKNASETSVLMEFNEGQIFLLQSHEFDWLLGRARVMATQMQTGPEAREVFEKLVKERYDRPHILTIDWDPLRFLQEQLREDSDSGSLGCILTLSGTDDLVEAASCATYMSKTWPSHGNMVLSCVESALKSMDGLSQGPGVAEATSDSGDVSLRVELNGGLVSASLEGEVLATAEAAQALCWLGAACRASDKPGTTKYSHIDLQPNHAIMTPEKSHWNVTYFSSEIPEHDSSCWKHIFNNPVVVKGFPVSRRPKREKGLELSLDALATLTQAVRATIFDGILVLKGFCNLLVAAAVSDASVVWHYLLSPDRKPVCYTEAVRFTPSSTAVQIPLLEDLRHFVGWTSSAEIAVGE